MQTILAPIFIKANFSLAFEDREFSFLNHGVSLMGITGLHWNAFDPIDKVGGQISVKVDVLSQPRWSYSTPAVITAECTSNANYLGVRYELKEPDRSRLAAVIKKEGYYPTEYVRKFPRIPAWSSISAMPLRAIVVTPGITISSAEESMVFDIANISPNGVLLASENEMSAQFLASQRIHAQVEPRGESHRAFEFDGMICRVVVERNLHTGNLTRYLGVRFLKVSPEPNFLAILRAVLANVQK